MVGASHPYTLGSYP